MSKDDDVELISVEGREVRVTHPDKPYFSREAKLSKLDLVRYYLSVAPGALAGIRDRPIVLKRFVDGAEGQPFYQKRAPEKRPAWLRTVTLSFPSGRTAEEVVVDDAAGLAWIVNLGCIELHPHPVRSGDLDHPDELRIDLDPTPGVAWADVRRVAMEVKALLDELGLRGWPKTSGSRGMHVNVRIEPRWTFTEVRRAALAFSREIERRAAGARDLEMVEGGAPRRVPRLQPERQGPHDLLGLFGAPAARRARLGAARLGRSAGLRAGRLHGADDAGSASRRSAIRTPAWTTPPGSLEALLELAARDEAAGLGDAPWPPHFPKDGGRSAARRAVAREACGRQRRRSRRARRCRSSSSRTRPTRKRRSPASSAGRASHPEAAKHLAVDDVLVDSMRGRSSTWTRIRVNLRNVPEAIRPPQETPDPDDDPTREWREAMKAVQRREPRAERVRLLGSVAKISSSSCGGTTSSCANVQSLGCLSGRQRRNCAVWRKRPPCM